MATITLSGTNIVENPEVGTIIGFVSVDGAQSGETFTYTLADSLSDRFEVKEVTVDGVARYALVVKTSAVDGASLFDFETKELSSFALSISAISNLTTSGTAVDAGSFTVSVTDVNEAPTGLTVTGGTVAELSAVGTQIATLAAIDPDQRDTFTYTLVADENGSPFVMDDLYFRIDGDKIVLKKALDDAQVGTHELWVKITDAGGLSKVEKVTVTVTDTPEVTGTNGNNRLVGTSGSDAIAGLGGNDKIYGLAGDDTINGGSGKDILYGGTGKDTFVFDSAVKKGHFDQVMDFVSADDTLQFSLSAIQGAIKSEKHGFAHGKKAGGTLAIEKALHKGKIEKKFFTVGDKAKDGNDYLYYNKKNGFVYLDLDGSGSKHHGLAILKLKPGTAISADDFVFI